MFVLCAPENNIVKIHKKKRRSSLIIHPSRPTLRRRTLMVAQCLGHGEKPPTCFARKLANLIVLRHFVSEPIVLPREPLPAAECAYEGYTRLGFVCLHMYFERILASETPLASGDEAWVAAA